MQNEGLIRNREAARDFIAIAVHDLREPLRAIGASSDILARNSGETADESTRRCLRYLQEGVTRMDALIHGIAEYCYEELREPEQQEVEMESALREAQGQLAQELKHSEATVTHDPLPAVKGDMTGLATVFRCLLDNACKFRGAAPLEVHIGAVKRETEWVFSVRDNGLGFKPVYADRIFRPFERLHGKQYPGSGLGLPLARTIVAQHGGRIWAEAELGQGSTFSFTLAVEDKTNE